MYNFTLFTRVMCTTLYTIHKGQVHNFTKFTRGRCSTVHFTQGRCTTVVHYSQRADVQLYTIFTQGRCTTVHYSLGAGEQLYTIHKGQVHSRTLNMEGCVQQLHYTYSTQSMCLLQGLFITIHNKGTCKTCLIRVCSSLYTTRGTCTTCLLQCLFITIYNKGHVYDMFTLVPVHHYTQQGARVRHVYFSACSLLYTTRGKFTTCLLQDSTYRFHAFHHSRA